MKYPMICGQCNKKISENAVKCPKSRFLLHSGCLRKHVKVCTSFHRFISPWRRKLKLKHQDVEE